MKTSTMLFYHFCCIPVTIASTHTHTPLPHLSACIPLCYNFIHKIKKKYLHKIWMRWKKIKCSVLSCTNPTLPLAAGVWSERSETSHLVSQLLPWSMTHPVWHSLVVWCPRLPGATPNQTKGRISDDRSWHRKLFKKHISLLITTLMCLLEVIGVVSSPERDWGCV